MRDDNAAAGPVREPDRVRVLEEAVQGARDLARGDPRGARHRGPRQEGRLLLPGELVFPNIFPKIIYSLFVTLITTVLMHVIYFEKSTFQISSCVDLEQKWKGKNLNSNISIQKATSQFII